MKVKDIKDFISIVIPDDRREDIKITCETAYLKNLKISLKDETQSKKKLFDVIRNSDKFSERNV